MDTRRKSIIGTPLEPWIKGAIPNFFAIRLGLGPLHAAFAVFFGYWGIPLLVNAVQGTLLPRQVVEAIHRNLLPLQIHIAKLDATFNWFATVQRLNGPEAVGYLNDRTHFLFATIMAVGAYIGAYLILHIRTAAEALREDGILSDKRLSIIYDRYRSKAYAPAGSIICLILAALSSSSFVAFSLAPHADYWWGSWRYGPAGLLFAIPIGFAVYWGTRSLFVLGYASLMLARLLNKPVELRPFHPDGCSGLSPVGRLIVLLWLYSAAVALAIFVTLHFGYLGIERTPVAWGITIIAAIFLPMLAFVPLIKARRSLLLARKRAIAALEPGLMTLHYEIETALLAPANSRVEERLPLITHAEKLYDTIKSANIWPFHRQITAAIFIGNILQFGLLTRAILGNSF